jgi:N-methylhydantoinase B
MSVGHQSSDIDPATLAVVQNALRQVVDEMDLTLERSAFNPVMSEGRDRANGIYQRSSGDVIAQGTTGLPIFVGVMQSAVKSALQAFPDLREGDVVLLNDPYCGGTHLMDVKLVRPFYYNGKHFAFLANCGHWTDIGGNVPGGFGIRAKEIIQEGVRIPPVLLYRNGKLEQGVQDILFANMRLPEERHGDLKAQIAALNIGEERLRALLDKYGDELVARYIDELAIRSEAQMRGFIRGIPDGDYCFETYLDSDGIIMAPIKVALKTTVAGDVIRFDFSGSSPPVLGPLNSSLSATTASVLVALKHIFPEVPVNGGIFNPIEINVPINCFLNAKYPRAVSGASAEVSHRVADAVFGCLAQAVPERVPSACHGTVANLTISGDDPIRKKQFIMFRFSGGGYGGHPTCDGLTNGNAIIGAARTSAVEILEHLYPLTFDFYRIRERSAGAGLNRGGLGMEFQVRLRYGEASSSVLADRGLFPPFGLHGGMDSITCEVEYMQEGRPYHPAHVSKDEGVLLKAGDTVRISTPGGGGWGNPLERDQARVCQDVRLGYLTAEDAERDYGVLVRATDGRFDVDAVATTHTRAARSSETSEEA